MATGMIDRAAAKAAGYTDAEIDAYERQQGLASSATQETTSHPLAKSPSIACDLHPAKSDAEL